ncbi:MAG: iron-sulfur cluster carrier protein ApbC [Gammaproteobacteria bacterium]|nr:iron-sulfur cluster carrier protein ApbC [Gammaproteobacteria bacterium]
MIQVWRNKFVVDKAQIEQLLKDNPDPYLGTDFVSAGAIRNLDIKNGKVSLSLQLGFPIAVYEQELRKQLIQLIGQLRDVESVDIDISGKIVAHAVQKTAKHLAGVKNIIAIASGKGGVGKSTTAANLALALQAEGAVVGLLDADIYGPSQARMMGMSGPPEATDNKKLTPKCPYGVQAMSIGLLIDEETAMIWRGPMVSQALQQLLNDTEWTDVDYLIIDLPPGTGDVQLTLSQQIPVAGAVIVTTPQDIALLDARRAVKMFEKVEVPVLGIVENMSVHICSQCGHAERIFGEGGGAKMAQDYGVELLGELPLDISIREQLDAGAPSVVADPEGSVAIAYYEIARKVAAKLSLRGKDYSGVFPKIIIENN